MNKLAQLQAAAIGDLADIVADLSRRVDALEMYHLSDQNASCCPTAQEDDLIIDQTFQAGQLARLVCQTVSAEQGTIVRLLQAQGPDKFFAEFVDEQPHGHQTLVVARRDLGHLLSASLDDEMPSILIRMNRTTVRLFVRAGTDGRFIVSTPHSDKIRFVRGES